MKMKKRNFLHKCLECYKMFPTKFTYDLHLQRKHFKMKSNTPAQKFKEEDNFTEFELLPEELKVEQISQPELIIKSENSEWEEVSLNDVMWQEEISDTNLNTSASKKTFVKCDFCCKQIPTFLFQNHVPAVHKFRFCCLCKESTFSSKHVHLKITDRNPEYYKCCKCTKTFVSIGLFRSHLATHYYCNFMCIICQKCFKSEEEIKEHLLEHQVSYQCKICDRKYLLPDEFKTHLTKNHESTEYHDNLLPLTHLLHRKYMKVSCEICKNTFSQLKPLTDHLSKEHIASIEALTDKASIEIKTTQVVDKKNLFQYISANHTIKKFSCTLCSMKGRTEEEMRRHNTFAHRAPKIYTCRFCNKEFILFCRYRSHLKHHLLKYVCKLCNKKFKRRYSRDLHVARIHRRAEKIKCKFCGRQYLLEFYYQKHISIKHKKEMDAMRD